MTAYFIMVNPASTVELMSRRRVFGGGEPKTRRLDMADSIAGYDMWASHISYMLSTCRTLNSNNDGRTHLILLASGAEEDRLLTRERNF